MTKANEITQVSKQPADTSSTAELFSEVEAAPSLPEDGLALIDTGRLETALRELDDVLSYYPFGFSLIAVGQTLLSVLNGTLEGNGLYFSIPASDIDAANPNGNRYNELKSALKTFASRPEVENFIFEESTLKFHYKHIPVEISVHTKDDKYLHNPAVKNIGSIYLQIPNPVQDYLGGVTV